MHSLLILFPWIAALVQCVAVPAKRDGGPITGFGFPTPPDTPKFPGSGFKDKTDKPAVHNPGPGMGQDSKEIPNEVYQPRDIDIPFGRLFHGTMKFFQKGELNTPDDITDFGHYNSNNDNANQSACGIPDNAYHMAKAAIHPYFLKYAGLDRKLSVFPST